MPRFYQKGSPPGSLFVFKRKKGNEKGQKGKAETADMERDCSTSSLGEGSKGKLCGREDVRGLDSR